MLDIYDASIALAIQLPPLGAFVQTVRKIDCVYVHTAGSPDIAVTADTIRRWHVARGFSGIGYHAVITHDRCPRIGADITWCRPEAKEGAHVRGYNDSSLGVCVTGHGDRFGHTPIQRAQLLRVLARWCHCYAIDPMFVFGHREAPDHPKKTCPGKLVDMDEIRSQLRTVLEAHYPREGSPVA